MDLWRRFVLLLLPLAAGGVSHGECLDVVSYLRLWSF